MITNNYFRKKKLTKKSKIKVQIRMYRVKKKKKLLWKNLKHKYFCRNIIIVINYPSRCTIR